MRGLHQLDDNHLGAIAAAGTQVTPGGAMEILALLGREEALRRLQAGLAKLQA